MNDPMPESAIDQERANFIRSLEQKLSSAGASFSEQAFGIGCSAITLPLALILGITYLLGNRTWTGLFLAGGIEILLGLALVNLYALRARRGAISRHYGETIWPEIQQYLTENNLTQDAFHQAAVRTLANDSLLVKALSGPSPAQPTPSKE